MELKSSLVRLNDIQKGTASSFNTKYPLYSSKEPTHIKVRRRKDCRLRRLSSDLSLFLNDKEVEKVIAPSIEVESIYLQIKRAHRDFLEGRGENLDKCLLCNLNKQGRIATTYAFYEIARMFDGNGLEYILLTNTYRNYAKLMGMHSLARFISNHAFLSSNDGKEFLEGRGAIYKSNELKHRFREALRILNSIQGQLGYSWFQLRVKGPYDAWEKIMKTEGKQDSSALGLHDIVGARIIFPEPTDQDRVELLEQKKEALLWTLQREGYYKNENIVFSNNNSWLREYHKNPKPNGYSRLHILLMKEGVPLEVQLDTEESYERVENSLTSIHGAHKNEALRELTNKQKIEVRMMVNLERGTRRTTQVFEGQMINDKDVLALFAKNALERIPGIRTESLLRIERRISKIKMDNNRGAINIHVDASKGKVRWKYSDF